jgi:hypothetical protein
MADEVYILQCRGGTYIEADKSHFGAEKLPIQDSK